MNRSIVAGAALCAGIAIATPMIAWSASEAEPPIAQASSGHSGMGPEKGMGIGGGPGGGDARGMAGHHHGWMHGMTQHSPQQRCEERLARRAGMIAYTVAKLNLTPEQRPLWEKLRERMQAAGDRQRQLCTALKPAAGRAEETVLDRATRREEFLTARLQAVQQTRPALEQLYQALTPEQKAIINHPFDPR
jgi:hypothetical protein